MKGLKLIFGEAEFGPEEHYEMREGEHFIMFSASI